MNKLTNRYWVLLLAMSLTACGDTGTESAGHEDEHGHGEEVTEAEEGPNGGRLLTDGGFAVELAIFEDGVAPEYRAWITRDGTAVSSNGVQLQVNLSRLGGRVDQIDFEPRASFLRGTSPVEEPHSFGVTVKATYQGRSHEWTYDSIEGRTRIEPDIARAFNVETEQAGPGQVRETIGVYGHIETIPERVSAVIARFDGTVREVAVVTGETVRAGQILATVESNDSLNVYTVTAPIAGVVTERQVNRGEQTAGRVLFRIVDTSQVWAEFSLFPADVQQVRKGMNVTFQPVGTSISVSGTIDRIDVTSQPNQTVLAHAVIDNSSGALVPGMYLAADIEIASHDAPLVVRRSGLQAFRDFTVVFAQVGEEYEVRMLDLGREDKLWVEVLGGLEPGTRYVTANSYLIKADIEKSGASHDH
ncbi:MAG: efflux RND transporter periplasmic adaptor subunit [Woeseia sp.]